MLDGPTQLAIGAPEATLLQNQYVLEIEGWKWLAVEHLRQLELKHGSSGDRHLEEFREFLKHTKVPWSPPGLDGFDIGTALPTNTPGLPESQSSTTCLDGIDLGTCRVLLPKSPGLPEPQPNSMCFTSSGRGLIPVGIPPSRPCLDGPPPPAAASAGSGEEEGTEGIHVVRSEGSPRECATWCIKYLSARLKSGLGRPLVSPEFSAAGLEGLRLIVSPDGKETAKGPRTRKEKDLFGKMVTEGPLDGRLRLKVPNCPTARILEFYMTIGSVRAGPFRQDFSELSMSSWVDFQVDWLSHVSSDQSLTVGVEILEAPAGSGDEEDTECIRMATWHIGHLSAKLKGEVGRPLVSPELSAGGLEGMRLLVYPDGKETATGQRTRKEKELFRKMVTEGPLNGRLRLKVPKCPAAHVLEFYLMIGDLRAGPFKQDFSEIPMSGFVDFRVDWLSQVASDQSLTVGVEILEASARRV